MKRFVSYSLISLMVGTLAGCSSLSNIKLPGFHHDKTSASQAQSSAENQEADTVSHHEAVKAPIMVTENTKAQADIHLKQQGDTLKATIITNWNGEKPGNLLFKWQAPKGSHCFSSAFPIQHYKDKHDVTTAHRSLMFHTLKGESGFCSGLWQAMVTQRDGKVVTSAHLMVAAPIPSKATQTSAKSK